MKLTQLSLVQYNYLYVNVRLDVVLNEKEFIEEIYTKMRQGNELNKLNEIAS
jgi:hypothetical protein